MRQGYHLTREEKIQIWTLYRDGMSINEVAERKHVSREVVSKITMGIRRKSSGWREGVCACGPDGWSPVQQQLDRRKLLDDAKQGEPIALRHLNSVYKLSKWWNADHGQIMGASDAR